MINGTTGDYLIQSSVLGSVLTKLKLNGAKDITYVPANGLVFPMQPQDQPYSSPPSYLSVVSRDPLGIQEDKNGYLSAYDPFGSLVANVQPPSGGPPPYTPFFGATYGGVSWNSFINANNFSGGCYSPNNNAALCNDAVERFNQDHPADYNPDFWSNLPSQHQDLVNGENDYISRVNGRYDNPLNTTGGFWLPPDDFIGRRGHFVPVVPHVRPQNSLVNTEDLKAYRARIDQMLKDKSCAAFIEKLLNEAKTLTGRSYNDVLGTFDSITFYWSPEKPWYGGHAFFEKGNPVATINNTVKTEKFINAGRTEYLISATTQSFFGETLHHVGVGGDYGDGVMAQSLNNILAGMGKAQRQTFDLRDVDPKALDNASRYWHVRVENFCRGPRQ